MRPLPKHFSQKLTDLVHVLLKPLPDKRPSADRLIQCTKLEKEVDFFRELVFLASILLGAALPGLCEWHG